MKKIILTVSLLVLVLFCGYAVPNDVIYSEGDATVKIQEGYVEDVYIGDVYDTGDTITTGYDGFVELDQEGLVVKINPDTVFTLQEKEEQGEKTGVFSLALGSIKFRYDRITGKEPMIQTASCVAGVRGTEFSVFAGADGSALIVVDSGLVEVESEGKAVQLTTDEGVEVQPGEPPGEKFVVQRDQIDYKSWNDDKVEAMLADPVLAMERLQDRLDYYIQNVEEYFALFEEYEQKLAQERQKSLEIDAKEGTKAGDKYRTEVISPLSTERRNLYLNLRYYSLAALSMRRYVGGRLYSFIKARYISELDNATYQRYKDRYEGFLVDFEAKIIPHIVEIDL
jgi:hypothetical protein